MRGITQIVTRRVLPILSISLLLAFSAFLIDSDNVSAGDVTFVRTFTPVAVDPTLNDWQLSSPTGNGEDADNEEKVFLISDGVEGTIDPTVSHLISDANNDHQLFFYDNPNITGGIDIHQVKLVVNALTEIKQGATKIELGVHNGTDFQPINDYRLSTTAKNFIQPMAANPHTLFPFDLGDFASNSFGWVMQTDAKPAHVFEQSVIVTFTDIEAPTFDIPSLPSDITREAATDPETFIADAELGSSPTATDNFFDDENDIIIFNNAPTDELYPVGTTTVTWFATDASGNSATFEQLVTIQDTTLPVFTESPLTQINQEGNTLGGATVALADPNVFDIFSVDITHNAPAVFQLGDTIVTWTATDSNGNSATADQTVTVVDTTPPVFTFVQEDLAEEGDTTGGLNVDLIPATADDFFPPVIITNDAPPAVFPLGETTVTWTATDDNGNESTAVQIVTVVDTTDPVITPPDDIEIPATQPSTVLSETDIGGPATASDIVDPSPVITNDIPAEGFPIGDNTVTWTATDASGNISTATQVVTLADAIAPVLTIPADVTITAQGLNTPVDINPENSPVTAEDNIDGALTVTNNAPAISDLCKEDDGEEPPVVINFGDIFNCFPPGVTEVTYSATDLSGNLGTKTQTIIVTGTPLEMGWHDGTFVDGFVLNNSPDYTTNIGSTGKYDESVLVRDFIGNADAGEIDTITLNVLNTNTQVLIQVTLTETDTNEGVFTNVGEFVTLCNDNTCDSTNFLIVSVNDVVTATYTSPVDEAEILTTVVDINQGQVTSTDFTMSTDKEGYKIGEYIQLSINDPAQAGGVLEENFPGGATMQSPTNQGIGDLPGGSCANASTTAAIGIKLNEDPLNSGLFTGTVLIGLQPNCSDRPNKIIGTAIGEEITFTYNISNGDDKIKSITVSVEEYSANEFEYDATGATFNLVKDVTNYDRDGDGIHDDWEGDFGLRITHDVEDENGNVIKTIKWEQACGPNTSFPICPSPDRKDIFVELDNMQFHELDDRAVEDVVLMFEDSPLCNPGGNLGCTLPDGAVLHILQDDQMPHEEFQSISEFHILKGQFFGTVLERTADGNGNALCTGCIGTPAEILPLKALVTHYGQSIHDQELFIGSSGDSEQGGNDFRISLGSWAGGTGTLDEQSGTLAHEIGHNLLLDHGGRGPLNCKPNLTGVMNYNAQFPDIDPTRPLDYSRYTLNTLDTSKLLEKDGVNLATYTDPKTGVPRTLNTIFGVGGVATVEPTGAGVDWNGNNRVEKKSVSALVHFIDIPGCDQNLVDKIIPTVNQWDVVSLDIKKLGGYGNGATLKPTSDAQGRGGDEPTAETFEGFLIAKILPLKAEYEALKEAGEIPVDEEGGCSELDVAFLDSPITGFDAVIDILGNDSPRSQQLKQAAKLMAAIENEGVLIRCLSGGSVIAGSAFTEQLISSSKLTGTVNFPSGEIDIGSKGAFTVEFFGTGESAGTDIFVRDFNPESIILMHEDQVGADNPIGAFIKHEFSRDMVKNTHYKFINSDPFEDVFLHYNPKDVGLNIANNNANGQQRLCLEGETIDVPPVQFSGCQMIDVVKKAGGGKGKP